MSAKVVVPDSIISSAASLVPMRTISGETVFASAGKMYFCSQSISARSSARPRYITIGACVWVLISPGRTISSRASIVSAARYFAAIASGASDLDDVGAVDGDGAGRDDVAGGVLRDHRAADDDERHRAPRRLRGARRARSPRW